MQADKDAWDNVGKEVEPQVTEQVTETPTVETETPITETETPVTEEVQTPIAEETPSQEVVGTQPMSVANRPLLDEPISIEDWIIANPGKTPTTGDLFPTGQTQAQLGNEVSRDEITTDMGVKIERVQYEGGYVNRVSKDGNYVQQAYYKDGAPMSRPMFNMDETEDTFNKYVQVDANGQMWVNEQEILNNFKDIAQDGTQATSQQKESTIDKAIANLQWSEERAGNGEQFLVGENGSIDLIDIPQEVFDAIGIPKIPFRLTPSMIAHVFDRHAKELKLKNIQDAVKAIVDVMTNFDHVRQGKNGTFVFSIEENRANVARRAVTIVLEYDNGEWLGN